MPITRRQFLGIDSETEERMRQIHAFLVARKEEAFLAAELRIELGDRLPGRSAAAAIPIFDKALDALAAIGAVEARNIGGQRYYALGPEPLEL